MTIIIILFIICQVRAIINKDKIDNIVCLEKFINYKKNSEKHE